MIRLVPFFVALLFLSGCSSGHNYKAVPVDSKTGHFPTTDALKSEDLIVSEKWQLERYKQLLYVMVVDGGGNSRYFYNIARNETHKNEIDTFFQKSFLEIGFFDEVLIVPQYEFEKIIISGEEKKRRLEKELAKTHSRQISSKLGALRKRHKEGAISDEEYMRKQREIVNEHARIIAGSIFSDPTGLDHVQEHYRDHLVVGIVIKHHSRQYRRWEVELKILDPATGDTVFHARNDLRVWGWYDEPLFYPLFNAFIDWIEKNSGGPNYSLFGANPDEKVLRTQ